MIKLTKILCFSLLLFCYLGSSYGSEINYNFKDVSLAKALHVLSTENPELHLSFIYNDLEDIKVSRIIKASSGKEAVKLLVKSLPVTVTEKRGSIFVESIKKERNKFIGRAVGENGEGIPYANVFLLSRGDSTVLRHGVSDVDGIFSIPCKRKEVILKLSSIGYHPLFINPANGNVGDVRMEILPVTLHNVAVEGERVYINSDRTVFMPNVRERNSAHGGADLLLKMGIPLLTVSPINHVITTSSGEGVKLFIDFLPADAQQIAGLRTQDVRKVEVYDYPEDPRFQGARHVVNFILVKYEYGGYTKFDGSHSLPDPVGNIGINSRFVYRKMTYDIDAGTGYQVSRHGGQNSAGDYSFPTGNILWKTSTDDTSSHSNSEYATFRAIYSSDNIVVSNTVGYVGDNARLTSKINNNLVSESIRNYTTVNRDKNHSDAFNWMGSYQFFMPHAWTMTVSPTIKYSTFSSNFDYAYSDDEEAAFGSSIHNHADEKALYGIIGVDALKRLGNHSLSLSAFGEYSNNRIRYANTEGTEEYGASRTESTTGAGGIRVGGSLRFGNVTINPSVRIFRLVSSFDEIKEKYWLPAYYVDFDWRVSQSHKLSLSSEMSNWTIGVAQRSPNIVVKNDLDAITGNPTLSPTPYNSVGLFYQWSVLKNLFISARCRYQYWNKPATYVYNPIEYEGKEVMLRSLINNGYYSELLYGVSASLSLLSGKIGIWTNVNASYRKRGGINRYDGNFARILGGVNYYLGQFYFSGYIQGEERSMNKDVERIVEPWYYSLSAGWGNGNFNISVTGSNLFRRNRFAGMRQMVYDHYTYTARQFNRSYTSGVTLNLSYSFAYGKQVKQERGPGRTNALPSGTLK